MKVFDDTVFVVRAPEFGIPHCSAWDVNSGQVKYSSLLLPAVPIVDFFVHYNLLFVCQQTLHVSVFALTDCNTFPHLYTISPEVSPGMLN